MLMEQRVRQIANDWITAWNKHDLDLIMSHYTDDIQFTSPFITKINNDPLGTIHNKVDLQLYFQRALNLYPNLHFELNKILVSVNSIIVYYTSVNNLLAAEFMQINEDGKVYKVFAHYTQ